MLVSLVERVTASKRNVWDVNVLLEMICDMWLEAIVIGIALHFYFAHAPRVVEWRNGAQRKGKRDTSVPERSSSTPNSVCQKAPAAKVQPAKKELWHDSKESQIVRDVQRLLQGANKRGARHDFTLYEEYKRIVKRCGPHLRRHLDEYQAHAIYSGLIGAVAVGSEPSVDGPANKEFRAQEKTSQLLSDMCRCGFARSQDFYLTIVRLFIRHRLFRDAVWVYDVMSAEGFAAVDAATFANLLKAAMSCALESKALHFFGELCKLGPVPVRLCMALVRVFERKKDWKGCLQVLSSMKESGAAPDALLLNCVLSFCVNVAPMEAAEGLLHTWGSVADVVSFNTVLKGYAQTADLRKAESLIKKMLQSGPEPNIISFNTAMDCAVRALQCHGISDCREASRRPWQLLQQMLELGLEPDRYTCSTLVKGMHLGGCSAEDIDCAIDLIHRVGVQALFAREAHIDHAGACSGNTRLLEVLFNTLLDACVTIRDLERMAAIFQLMQEFGVSVSSVTLGTLIKAFGQAGRLSHCHEVWQKMHESAIVPTVVTFGCYIDACTRNGDVVRGEKVLLSMKELGVQPNAVIYTSLIRGFAQAKQPDKALNLYKEMQQDGIPATLVTFNSVLDVVARQAVDPSQIRSILEEMRIAGMAPDVVTYSILLKSSCSSELLGDALSLVERIRTGGVVLDEVGFNTLLQTCSKTGQIKDGERLFEQMIQLGRVPTHVTISILVKMYGKAKMPEKAFEVSERVEREFGIKPNVHVYTCLIQACVQNKMVKRSWEVFNTMLRSRIEPDSVTLGAVMMGCIHHHKFEQAMSVARYAYGVQEPGGASASTFAFNDCFHGRGTQVQLQPDILEGLQSALKRKGEMNHLAELKAMREGHQPVHVYGASDVLAGTWARSHA